MNSEIAASAEKSPGNEVENSMLLHVADTKRGKMCTREPRLVLVSLLVG